MGKVKWIKITTNMFDNRKIRQIRHLPEGNNIVLIWVMLLTIAGRCNAGGMIFLTENIPYTLQSLALELDFDTSVVELALNALRDFGMIVCDEQEFFIANWEEYQSADRLDKIREYQKNYHREYREKQKLLAADLKKESKVPSKVYVNSLDKEEDKELRNKTKNIYEAFAAGDTALLEALKEFDSFRKKVKKPLTDKAKERLINKLKTFPRDQWVDILLKSVDKGWTDVYPLADAKPASAPKQIDRSFRPTEF